MLRTVLLFMIALVATVTLTSCAKSPAYVDKDLQYAAYGRTWRYLAIEHYGQRWGLFTGHGYIGLVETIEQEVFLDTIGKERVPVHDRLYALQKDGTYKKIKCCDWFGSLANVYQTNDKLFVYLSLGRNVTDCFVYPAGHPDNEKRPPGERVNVIDYFGEFDPEQGVFRINSFYKGGITVQTLYGNAPNWKEVESKESLEAYRTRLYQHRSPFECTK